MRSSSPSKTCASSQSLPWRVFTFPTHALAMAALCRTFPEPYLAFVDRESLLHNDPSVNLTLAAGGIVKALQAPNIDAIISNHEEFFPARLFVHKSLNGLSTLIRQYPRLQFAWNHVEGISVDDMAGILGNANNEVHSATVVLGGSVSVTLLICRGVSIEDMHDAIQSLGLPILI